VQRQPTADGGVTDEGAFQVALAGLLQEAAANGVDVRGGWPVERHDAERAWDVEIVGGLRRSTATIDDTEVPAPAIVDAVAERKGVDEAGLHSLYDAIGPDILEILHESDADSGQSVTFESHGDSVTVRLDGSIVLNG